MGSSITYPRTFEMPAWKTFASVICAVLIGLLFIVSGGWKLADPFGWAARLAQTQFPAQFSLPGAMLVGTAETLAGVMLLIPRFRRWGALLTGALLVAFMLYIGYFYDVLRGQECSCFPWVKRFVGPGFFIGDGIMLLLAGVAGWWARPSQGMRSALAVLAAVAAFAGVSYGVNLSRHTGVKAPDSITVDSKPFSLQQGKVFVYFYDPECSHCSAAAKAMTKYQWADVKLVGVPTRVPQFAQEFMEMTGWKAGTSPDLAVLQKTFPFTAGPYAVALEDGYEKKALQVFEGDEPEKTLRAIGFVK